MQVNKIKMRHRQGKFEVHEKILQNGGRNYTLHGANGRRIGSSSFSSLQGAVQRAHSLIERGEFFPR
jgi:hypothetical protein